MKTWFYLRIVFAYDFYVLLLHLSVPYLMILYTSNPFQSKMLYFLFHYIHYLTDVITRFLLSLRLFMIFILCVNGIRNN